MLTRRAVALVVLLLALATPAARSQQPFYYLNPAELDLTMLLPPPPDASSAEARSDETQAAAFFSRVGSDVKELIGLAKSYWERPRPDGGKKRSYPSGHAAFAAASAIVLAKLIPAKRDAVFGEARTFAENRIILGLHYPSDIAWVWTAGTLRVYAMMQI